MIKAIFFDVANTLLHKPSLIENMQTVFKKFGHYIALNDIQQTHQKLTEEVIFPDATTKEFYLNFNWKLCESLGIEASDSLANDIYEASRGLEWGKFDDLDIIESLSLPLGIASNWDKSLRNKLKQFFQIEFEWTLVSEELGVKKPQPDFFHKMIETSGFMANELMFVGDSMRLDIEPATKAGIQTVLIDRNNFYTNYDGVKIKSMNQLTSQI